MIAVNVTDVIAGFRTKTLKENSVDESRVTAAATTPAYTVTSCVKFT